MTNTPSEPAPLSSPEICGDPAERPVFSQASIEKMLSLGMGLRFDPTGLEAREMFGRGRSIFCSTGISIAAAPSFQESAIFTIAMQPDASGMRFCVLSVAHGVWTGEELVRRALAQRSAYASTLCFGTNHDLAYFWRYVEDPLPSWSLDVVQPPATADNKALAVLTSAIAGEMERGQWACPPIAQPENAPPSDTHEQAGAWIDEMRGYMPGEQEPPRLWAAMLARCGARKHAAEMAQPAAKVGALPEKIPSNINDECAPRSSDLEDLLSGHGESLAFVNDAIGILNEPADGDVRRIINLVTVAAEEALDVVDVSPSDDEALESIIDVAVRAATLLLTAAWYASERIDAREDAGQ